jgi:uncharacterized protein
MLAVQLAEAADPPRSAPFRGCCHGRTEVAYLDRQLLKECRRGHLPRIQRLLAEGADVNHRGQYGYSPVLVAASRGHVDVVRFLLGAGADATVRTHDNAPTLFYACAQGHAEVVELLLAAGADPNARRDSDGPTPAGDSPGVSMLHIAIRDRHARIVEALLRAGAATDFVKWGHDALAAAMATEDPAIIDLVRRSMGRR